MLVATILGSALAFMDGSVVNVALPALQAAFHATAGGIQWVVQGYALFGAALLLLGGAIGDHYGRRRAYVWGVALFARHRRVARLRFRWVNWSRRALCRAWVRRC